MGVFLITKAMLDHVVKFGKWRKHTKNIKIPSIFYQRVTTVNIFIYILSLFFECMVLIYSEVVKYNCYKHKSISH